jgi:hypothetical protein
MKKSVCILQIVAILAVGCNDRVMITYLDPHVFSSGFYTCNDFEKYWETLSEEKEVVNHLVLGSEFVDNLILALDRVEYSGVVGGYSPVYKFEIGNSMYCVTSTYQVLKNDEEVGYSPEVGLILEQAIEESLR